MRPKKRILLIDSNEYHLSVRRFLLDTHRFAVTGAQTSKEALQLADECMPEAIVAVWPFTGGDLGRLLNYLHEIFPGVPSILICENLSAPPEGVVADAVMLRGACSPAEILDRVKVLSARKRGPKKGVNPVNRAMILAERRIA